MSRKLDQKKALYLEPNRRTIPGRKRRKAQTRARAQRSNGAGKWVEHKSDAALDQWGLAIRVLRKAGVLPEQDRSF